MISHTDRLPGISGSVRPRNGRLRAKRHGGAYLSEEIPLTGNLPEQLNDAFIEYVASIARCLRSPNRDTTVLIYYASLDDLARDLPNAPRAESVRRLDEIITRFQSFYGDVKANHLRLKRLCSI